MSEKIALKPHPSARVERIDALGGCYNSGLMRLHEARKIIVGKADDEDVAELLGAARGTLTAGHLRAMMQGRHDQESVNPNHDGVGVFIADWSDTKSCCYR